MTSPGKSASSRKSRRWNWPKQYFDAGPARYLWNSGMFVWRARTLLDCIRRYEPGVFAGLDEIAVAWDTPRQARSARKGLSAVEEDQRRFRGDGAGLARSKSVRGRHPDAASLARRRLLALLRRDLPPRRAAKRAGRPEHVLIDSRGCLAASSDPEHLIALVGCENLLVVHTPDATLVCPADQAEKIKELYKQIESKYG